MAAVAPTLCHSILRGIPTQQGLKRFVFPRSQGPQNQILRGIPTQQGLKHPTGPLYSSLNRCILRGIPTQQGLKHSDVCSSVSPSSAFSEVFQHNKD